MVEIQNRMFTEMQDQEIFRKALAYGLHYIERSLERNVYPSEEALANLGHFEEPMPAGPSDAGVVIDLLHRSGAPATVSQIGGRYFGFVNGSAVPTGMAATIL